MLKLTYDVWKLNYSNKEFTVKDTYTHSQHIFMAETYRDLAIYIKWLKSMIDNDWTCQIIKVEKTDEWEIGLEFERVLHEYKKH